MARTITAKREAHIRAGIAMSTTPDEQALLGELDAERRVSDALAVALEEARNVLDECARDTSGTPSEKFFGAKVAGFDQVLALYRESKQ